MKPRVFVFQPIPQVAIDTLVEVADVTVYPHLDRMISMDEMIGAATRHDYLLALHENFVPGEVLRANPDLKGVGILGGKTGMVDYDAALELKIPVVSVGREMVPSGGPSKNTADLTVALLLATWLPARRAAAGNRARRLDQSHHRWPYRDARWRSALRPGTRVGSRWRRK